MTEIRMKRIGLRLIVLSVISLIIFVSIRRQYNTAQSLLQRKVVQISLDSPRTGPEPLDQIEQRVASVQNVPELESTWSNDEGDESMVNGEETDEIDDRSDIHEIESEKVEDADGIDYDAVSAQPQNLLDSFMGLFKLKSGDTHIVHEIQVSNNKTVSVDDDLDGVERGENVTFQLSESSKLRSIEASNNASDEEHVIENGAEIVGVEVKATSTSELEVTTHIDNNDAAETDGKLTQVEDDADDLIKEYDEYPEKDKDNAVPDTAMAANQQGVLSNIGINVSQEIYAPNSINPDIMTTSPKKDSVLTVGTVNEAKSIMGEGDHLGSFQFDQRQQPLTPTSTGEQGNSLHLPGEQGNSLHLPGEQGNSLHLPGEQGNSLHLPGEQGNSLHLLHESINPKMLMFILGKRFSPRMATYLYNRIFPSLKRGTTPETNSPATPAPVYGPPTNDPPSLSQPALIADSMKTISVTDGTNERQTTLEDSIADADNVTDNDNNTVSNDDLSSVYDNQPTTFNVETTTSRLIDYNNPRPLSDGDFSILRTNSYVPKIMFENNRFTSPPSNLIPVRDEFKTNSPAPFAENRADIYPTAKENHELNSEPLKPPSWLISNIPDRDSNLSLNEPQLNQPQLNQPQLLVDDSNYREKIVFHPEQLPNHLQNTVLRIQPSIDGTPQNSPLEKYSKDLEHFAERRKLAGHQDQFLYQIEEVQSKPGNGTLLQDFNDPDKPGQSYNDVLMQQKILIDPVLEETSIERIVSSVESISEVRAGGCPRQVKLSEKRHPLTALVAFPGDDTDWIRNILEQLFGETTDSVYQVTADLSGGSSKRLHEMDRNIAVQTNTAVDDNFQRAMVVLRNPYSVEERHRMFRPISIDWQKQHLWGDTYASWLSSGLPTYVVVFEDLVENPLTELIRLTDFLRSNGQVLNYKCAMSVAEKPPKLVSDLKQITGIYYKERQKINENIDKVIQVAKTKYPLLLARLESYKVYI
ncbi:hypothetical protein Btru_045020 [Bulinus truncatus]|nr:hypothetical protein Btru_045020 [Bulinus truncatus]